MFGWLRRWLFRRQRFIFQFWDGRRYRYADPIAVHLALQEDPEFEFRRHMLDIDQGVPEATHIACRAVQRAFGVEAYDEAKRTGLLVGEQLGLLLAFYRWIEVQKKSTEPSVTSASNTGSTDSPSNDATTSATADSTSTSIDRTCATPITSDMPSTAP